MVTFMPEFFKGFSTSEDYLIILIQQLSSIPGVILGSRLVETKLGRKYTSIFAFIHSAICCYLFYVDNSPINVNKI